MAKKTDKNIKIEMTRGRFYYMSDNLWNWGRRNKEFFYQLLAYYLDKAGVSVYNRRIKGYREMNWSDDEKINENEKGGGKK